MELPGTSQPKLTFTDDKAYNEDDGTEMTTIDQAFKKGDKVVGKGDITLFANTPAFSTTLYDGNGTSKDILTSISNTEKALVWVKGREREDLNHTLVDTERPKNAGYDSYPFLRIDDQGQFDLNGVITDLTSNGYSAGNSTGVNKTSIPFVAWNFRAAPGFFDVVPYVGTNANDDVPHSLDTTPGFILIKRIDSTSDWFAYAKYADSGNPTSPYSYKSLKLNTNAANTQNIGGVANSTTFRPQSTGGNIDGANYVAYLFADTPGLIKCDQYPGSGTTQQTIRTGFKVGWLMIKTYDSNDPWVIFDNKRNAAALYPNDSSGEIHYDTYIEFDDTDGFTLNGNIAVINATPQNYIYVAIAENASAGQMPPTVC